MTTIGKTLLASGVALAVLAGGCGDDACPDEAMDLIDSTVPASCSGMAPDTTVTVSFEACARCNQTNPTCSVDASQPGFIELNTLGEACDSGSSCPLPSCGLSGPDRRVVSCTFRSPAAGSVDLIIHDAAGPHEATLTVNGADTTCSG